MKWIMVFILISFSVLVVIPPLHYQYIYPNAGDDTAQHLKYFRDMSARFPLYWGQYVMGKLINVLPVDPTVFFLWFHFAVFILALWSIAWSVGLAVNYLAGTLACIMVFITNNLLQLFHWGQIFDIAGIAVLLPFVFLCLHKIDEGKWWKVGAAISLVSFSLFHTNGQTVYAIIPIAISLETSRHFLSRKYKHFADSMRALRFIVYVGLVGVIMLFLFLVNFRPTSNFDPGRFWLDGSILLMMGICAWLGLYLNTLNKKVVIVIVVFALIFAIPNIRLWLENDSAIKDVDKEAIAFLNSSDGQTYTATPQIAEDVYGLFINKQFVNGEADYLVSRTTPETPYSDPQSPFFENWDRIGITIDGYRLIKQFDNGEKDVLNRPIVVSVYGRE